MPSDLMIRRHTRYQCDWSSDVCSSDLVPQLYVKGEFVGGCDIVTEMFQSGELETLLTDKGVETKTQA